MGALLTSTYRVFYGAFKRAQKSRMARSLDAEFERFDMPRMAKRFKMRPTPSNIVLGTDDAIIRLSEFAKYEEILARAKKQNGSLRTLEARMGHVNREMLRRFMSTRIIHRGMGISEFCTISKMGGAVGLHRRRKYAAINNFDKMIIPLAVVGAMGRPLRKRGTRSPVEAGMCTLNFEWGQPALSRSRTAKTTKSLKIRADPDEKAY